MASRLRTQVTEQLLAKEAQFSEQQTVELTGLRRRAGPPVFFGAFLLLTQTTEQPWVAMEPSCERPMEEPPGLSQISGTTNTLIAVSFSDSNAGTTVGNSGTIVRTTNGGINWVSQSRAVTTGSLEDVVFVDTNTGTAVGEGGAILRTADGGANWVSQTSGTTNWLLGASFSDASHGTAVGFFGTILRTTDGGNTWTPQTSGTE